MVCTPTHGNGLVSLGTVPRFPMVGQSCNQLHVAVVPHLHRLHVWTHWDLATVLLSSSFIFPHPAVWLWVVFLCVCGFFQNVIYGNLLPQ